MNEPKPLRCCFGCAQPIEEVEEATRDLLGRMWHRACYDRAAENFLTDVKAKLPRHV